MISITQIHTLAAGYRSDMVCVGRHLREWLVTQAHQPAPDRRQLALPRKAVHRSLREPASVPRPSRLRAPCPRRYCWHSWKNATIVRLTVSNDDRAPLIARDVRQARVPDRRVKAHRGAGCANALEMVGHARVRQRRPFGRRSPNAVIAVVRPAYVLIATSIPPVEGLPRPLRQTMATGYEAGSPTAGRYVPEVHDCFHDAVVW